MITGCCVSRTITRCWPVAVLPLPSVASQTTRLVPTENILCDDALLVTLTTASPQVFVAVAVPSVTFVASHSPRLALFVTSAGG